MSVAITLVPYGTSIRERGYFGFKKMPRITKWARTDGNPQMVSAIDKIAEIEMLTHSSTFRL